MREFGENENSTIIGKLPQLRSRSIFVRYRGKHPRTSCASRIAVSLSSSFSRGLRCAFTRATVHHRVTISNLSLIESRVKRYSIRDPGGRIRPTERRAENASRTRKRASRRYDKRNGSRLQLPPLPSPPLLTALSLRSRGRALRGMDARG